MQYNRGQIELQNAHILNDQGIGTGMINIPNELFGQRKLCVGKHSIQGYIDFYPETVSISHQGSNIFN
ncbi:hypothetical protein SDC9_103210 [bioreactor metagenome]|uniref:Uncharacterized protein n=1 Tax=bioreactor metagenome TaxID=1076179 RepID=A0A645ATK7_9ZZZZ